MRRTVGVRAAVRLASLTACDQPRMLSATTITGGTRGRCGPVALLRPHALSPRQEGIFHVIALLSPPRPRTPAPIGAHGAEAL
jgi:hypothetical protein